MNDKQAGVILMAVFAASGVIVLTDPSEQLFYNNLNMGEHNITNVSLVCDSVRCYNLTLIVNDITINTTTLYVLRNNWTSIDNYPIACEGDEWYVTELGDTLTCVNANATIDNRLATIYYNVTQVSLIAGTSVDVLSHTWHSDGKYDGLTFNLTDASGSPGIDARMNFTNITSFNTGVIRYKTSTLAGDFPLIQLWNYEGGVWEDYPRLSFSVSFATITQPVFDSTDHIENGVVRMRLYKAANGNINNHYYIDWIAISKGYGTPSGVEVDPYWNSEKNNVFGNLTVLKTGSNTVPYWTDTGGFIAANDSINSGDVWIPGQQNTTGNAYFTGEVEMCGGDCSQKLKFINSLGLIGFLSSETLFKYVNANTMELQVCDDVSCQGYGFLRVEDVAKPDFKIGSVSGKVYVNNSITGYGDINATGEVCDSATCVSLLAANVSASQVEEDVLAGNVTAMQTGSNTIPYWMDESNSIMSNESINSGAVNVTGGLTVASMITSEANIYIKPEAEYVYLGSETTPLSVAQFRSWVSGGKNYNAFFLHSNLSHYSYGRFDFLVGNNKAYITAYNHLNYESIDHKFIPVAQNSEDLGDATHCWQDLYYYNLNDCSSPTEKLIGKKVLPLIRQYSEAKLSSTSQYNELTPMEFRTGEVGSCGNVVISTDEVINALVIGLDEAATRIIVLEDRLEVLEWAK